MAVGAVFGLMEEIPAGAFSLMAGRCPEEPDGRDAPNPDSLARIPLGLPKALSGVLVRRS